LQKKKSRPLLEDDQCWRYRILFKKEEICRQPGGLVGSREIRLLFAPKGGTVSQKGEHSSGNSSEERKGKKKKAIRSWGGGGSIILEKKEKVWSQGIVSTQAASEGEKKPCRLKEPGYEQGGKVERRSDQLYSKKLLNW